MGRPKTYDRDQVLDRAMKLFWDKGYEGAHLRELVEVAGISRFSLYQEFGGKQGLYEEAMALYIAGLGGLADILARQPLGLDNIRAFFRSLLDFGFRHGCFAMNTIREKNVIPQSVFDAVAQVVTNDEQAFRLNLEAARAAGSIPASVDVDGQAKLITAFGIGILSYGIVEPDAAGLEQTVAALERLWT
jgi:TetR/AcrR family transcriptional repressor of nem operon